MELKLFRPPTRYYPKRLLIVPYGIETKNAVEKVFAFVTLLIVPYGIETGNDCNHNKYLNVF